MRWRIGFAAAAVALWAASGSLAAMTEVVQGGDFEDMDYLKTVDTIDDGGYAIGPQKWNADEDAGLWLSFWGKPGTCPATSCIDCPCDPGGFSSVDNPRDPAVAKPWTRDDLDVSNLNRSVDPYDSGNHILDNVLFRPELVQYVQAPANQVPGPMRFSFDFFYDDWDTAAYGQTHEPYNDHTVVVRVYGLNFLPAHDQHLWDGEVMNPLGNDPVYNPVGDGELLLQFRWGGWFTDDDWSDDDSTNGWVTLDTANVADPTWTMGGESILTTNLSTTYDYYAVNVRSVTYTEVSLLWILSTGGGDIVPTFSQGFDNFSLQVTTALLGDVNEDGYINNLDISWFIRALTDPDFNPPEADINQDGSINNLDISPFIQVLTGGSGQIIPEPATGVLLALAGLVVLRRRRCDAS